MITRRSFLAALSALPFVGKWFQAPAPSGTYTKAIADTFAPCVHSRLTIVGGEAFWFTPDLPPTNPSA